MLTFNFEIGDRVRLIRTTPYHDVGALATIVNIVQDVIEVVFDEPWIEGNKKPRKDPLALGPKWIEKI